MGVLPVVIAGMIIWNVQMNTTMSKASLWAIIPVRALMTCVIMISTESRIWGVGAVFRLSRSVVQRLRLQVRKPSLGHVPSIGSFIANALSMHSDWNMMRVQANVHLLQDLRQKPLLIHSLSSTKVHLSLCRHCAKCGKPPLSP